MKDVLMKEQYVQFVDLALKQNSEEDDFAMTMWSMDLSKRTRKEFIRVLKEDYKGSPKTRHQAKIYASQGSPRVKKAWKCYNRMLQTDLSILQILDSINNMNISLWSYDELVLFDRLIDTQMTFNAIEDFKYCNYNCGASEVYTGCSLGQCEKWNMIIVPMLKTENENAYLNALKSLIGTVIGDCKWYYGNINAQFLTKSMELVKITDPVDFTDLDYRVDEFIYNSNEQQDAYEKMLRYALIKLPLRPPDFGRYILILTNFERSLSGIVIENNEKLVDKITEYGIQLRTIRVEFDGNRATHINPDRQYSVCFCLLLNFYI
uniref:Uncharacterized protein n=1 Tax=Panagrolaimus sp. PS1159 TaxID=55785 RepID=A0AC35GBB4_9BILA